MKSNTELILCILSSPNEAVTSNWVYSQLIEDLQNEYKISLININKYNNKNIIKKNNEISSEIISQIKSIKFFKKNIVFFTMLFDKYLNDNLFDFLNSRSIISVNYLVDSITIPYKYYLFAKKFTYIAVPFQESVEFFKKRGINNVIYFPYGTSFSLNKYYLPSKQNAISFVGTNYGVRPYYIDFLNKNSIFIDVKGSNWKQNIQFQLSNNTSYFNNFDLLMNLLLFKNGRKILVARLLKYFKSKKNFNFNYDKILKDQDVFKFIADHNLSLGISEYGSTYLLKNPIFHYRMRDLECPMLGSCHITHASADLVNLYEENKEMLFYTNDEELKNKLKYYLKNPSLSSRIGYNANMRSKSSNRWLNRFDDFNSKYLN